MSIPTDDYSRLVGATLVGAPDLKRVSAARAIRSARGGTLRETLIFIAGTFGFKPSDAPYFDNLDGWRAFLIWQDKYQVSLAMVQGPHAITVLKAIAAKHNRNVSTGQ